MRAYRYEKVLPKDDVGDVQPVIIRRDKCLQYCGLAVRYAKDKNEVIYTHVLYYLLSLI